ncbi:Dolichyl-phosphate-mannose-protein mannosyltransferase-domain-containing protein [Cunninghamella echinulata]|nr:Dolichyl-phosphate-mannose-protein mannosyltransferase-domain-containing protein [Cunninghamella echinulata]
MKLYHYVNKKSITLTLISFWTRFRLIDKSNIVVWDEAHFGKFGAHYIEHEYYVDVHPPLAKLLVALSQWITGFDGKFKFESGAAYPNNVDYRSMRLFQAFWGSLVVPLAYITTQQFDLSRSSCILSALMVLCDTAYLCINRFILLDSVLLFFTALSLYSLFGFHNVQNKSFTFLWWIKLSLLGISLGCVLSVKWVGLFTVALVGIYTIEDLWEKLADSNISNMEYLYHWIARILNLIILPAIVYLLCFKIHFNILYKSGPGDQSMSSLFQATLKGNEYENTPLELAFGSNITLRNFKGEKPFLHSHPNYYPYGSQLQQITGYYYNDTNNEWTILSTDKDNHIEKNSRYVHHGDTIRLNHIATNINLLATSYPSPLSLYTDELLFEVSGGNKTILSGDIIDHWKITTVKDINNYKGNKIHSFTTLFQLRHVVMDCLLVSTDNILPKWGYKQLEIACIRDGNENDPSTFWSIDMHKNIHLPTPIKGTYKSTFLRNFLELNQLMWNINNGLVSDPDKEDILSSTPSQWPLMSTGVRMIGWDDNILKFYLLGNPIVWWASFASVIIFSISATIYTIRAHRNIVNKSQDIKKWKIKVYIGKYLFIGWFLHYIPFFIMGRVMYLHHYFQALYFSILLVSYLFDHFTMNFSKIRRLAIYAIFMMFIVLNFIYFSPFAYGMHGAIKKYEGRRWLKSWNLTKIY